MIHLALDVCEKRIGVAVSDETETLAAPRTIIRRTSTAAVLEAVARLVADFGAEVVVVGLPVSFDGQLHGQARAIQTFAAKLRRRIAQPVRFADEHSLVGARGGDESRDPAWGLIASASDWTRWRRR